MVGCRDNQAVSMRHPSSFEDAPNLGRQRARLPAFDVDHPQAGWVVVAIDDAGVVFILVLLLFGVALGVGSYERDLPAVGRPLERADSVLALGQASRVASVGRYDVDLRWSVAIGEKCEL